jgi:hypothetical protein
MVIFTNKKLNVCNKPEAKLYTCVIFNQFYILLTVKEHMCSFSAKRKASIFFFSIFTHFQIELCNTVNIPYHYQHNVLLKNSTTRQNHKSEHCINFFTSPNRFLILTAKHKNKMKAPFFLPTFPPDIVPTKRKNKRVIIRSERFEKSNHLMIIFYSSGNGTSSDD